MEEINVSTNERNELIDITAEVRNIVKKSGVKNGICIVCCPHTTAGITINEGADPDVKRDILMWLNKLVPENSGFKHSEGNSDSHVKSSLIGVSETLVLKDSDLVLGTWQNLYFAEFDGPRKRKVIVKIIEE
ncbi:secondary thiamine-phosphate synthase enzyme YjbQ [Candidatus Woesearchaeota archaeon]|nr:secondary thiamine-phosphate synthase enzyme YjbQ [Candidatus Woesearchaeota archaeon]